MESYIVAYYSLGLIIIGTLLNMVTFFIFGRVTNRSFKTGATLYYMRSIAIFDTLMLYGWNLDHFLSIFTGSRFIKHYIGACKFVSFISFFAAQVSAWLRVFVCYDRFLSLTHLHQTCFNRKRNVSWIIAAIIISSFSLNLHLLLFACHRNANGIVDQDAVSYKIYPTWNFVHLALYNCIPCVAMMIINGQVIYRLIRLRQSNMINQTRIQHRSITWTLLITTTLFLIMTIPATVAFGFFHNANLTILRLLDAMLHSYHVCSIFIYFISLKHFRCECRRLFTCPSFSRQIVTDTAVLPNPRVGVH